VAVRKFRFDAHETRQTSAADSSVPGSGALVTYKSLLETVREHQRAARTSGVDDEVDRIFRRLAISALNGI